MAGIAYSQNYVAPQARDAERDLRAQHADLLPMHGPVCPPEMTTTEELSSGQYICSMSGAWFQVVSSDPGSSHFLAREMTDEGLGEAAWLPAADGWDLLTTSEVDDWQSEVDAREDRLAEDRLARWGGGWDMA